MRRISLLLLAAVCMVTLNGGVLIAPAEPLRADGVIPAPTGGPAPTIALSVDHGYTGQTVTVTGQSVAPYPGVRVAWLLDGATQTAAVVTSIANVYTATLAVPDDAAPGAAQICAAVTGTPDAEFACAPFTIEAPPPGSVTGKIPLTSTLLSTQRAQRAQTIAADFVLFDNAGTEVTRAPIQPDGSFTVTQVPRGYYQTGVIGTIPVLVETPPLIVEPGILTPAPVALSGCRGASASAISANPSSAVPLSAVPGASPGSQIFGAYVNLGPSGTPVNVTFNAALQVATGTVITDVLFEIKRPDGSRFTIGTDPTAPYQSTYNVSLLPVGTSTLYVTVRHQLGSCTRQALIHVIADPMKDPNIQPGGVTAWNTGTQRYHFQGAIPNVGGVLPLVYTTPSLPLVGTLESRLSAGLFFSGTLELNGLATLTVVNAAAFARLLNNNVYNSTQALLGTSTVTFNRYDPINSTVNLAQRTLLNYNVSQQVFSGPLASFWGVITVKASVSVGMSGQLLLQGTIKPLKPAAEIVLTPVIAPRITASVWIDLLLSVASAGADVVTTAAFYLPLRINTEATPKVKFDQTCLKLTVALNAWARVNLRFWKKTWNIGNYTLLTHNPCGLLRQAIGVAATQPIGEAVPPPSVIASPSIASSPSGRLLAVYVVNTTPDQITPTMRIAAAAWNTQTLQFDDPQFVSDGTHAVQDPVVAYTNRGGQETPVVAWTETVMTADEDDNGPVGDLNFYLRRQEIFAATLISGTWSVPQRLTDDLIPDGRAALAGDATHLRLAWTRDLDGDINTRGDARIATTAWREATGWDSIELLAAPTISATSSNSQVSVALAPPGQKGDHLAWTVDLDANLDTNGDRYLAWANDLSGSWDTAIMTETQHFPAGIDSPSIAIAPQSIGGYPHFAFIVRGKDGDGVTDTGLGNRGQLWRAWHDGSGWHSEPVMDGSDVVYAERPVLNSAPDGRTQLLFRRFGEAGTAGELGQLALTVASSASDPLSPPLYLTGDDARQHGQASFARDAATGDVLIVNVSRAAVAAADQARLQQMLKPASAARSATQPQTLSAQDDPVEALRVAAGADPAIDPAPALTAPHALPGATVWVTATVRNVGLDPASDIVVRAYTSGTILSPIGVFTVTGPLEVNATAIWALPVTRTAGSQRVLFEIEASSSNTNAANDTAFVDLHALPAPEFVGAATSTLVDQALDVMWLPVAASGVDGYRVLRRAANGPATYELVGETTRPAFTDRLLQPGQTYCYVVAAYDAAGILSPNSDEACGTLNQWRVWLPLIMKTL